MEELLRQIGQSFRAPTSSINKRQLKEDQASRNYVTASTCGLAFPAFFLELTANAIESILGESHGLGIKRGARLIQ
jgi:hypothetical protein